MSILVACQCVLYCFLLFNLCCLAQSAKQGRLYSILAMKQLASFGSLGRVEKLYFLTLGAISNSSVTAVPASSKCTKNGIFGKVDSQENY